MTSKSLAALAALLAVTGARAASPPATLTISGGVSLGAYEAGLVHYSVETMRLNPAASTFQVVTGASAGSVNGFMTVLQSCGAQVKDPGAGLFWNAWIPLGLDKLYDPKNQGKTSAFSRAAFAAPLKLIEDAWRAGLPESCDVVFGLSVTRLVPRTLSFKGERLQLPRVEEHFAVRIQGRGPGKTARLTNYVDTSWDGEQSLLAEKDGEVVFSVLVDALFASTAFPGAFAPQAVQSCVVRDSHVRPSCPIEEAKADLFVDGGVFDNTPVRLAIRLASSGLRLDAEGKASWLQKPDLAARKIPDSLVIAYVSTEARTFPAPENAPPKEKFETLLGVAAQVGGAFYTTARAKNMVYLQEDNPEIFERILIPQRHLPAASSPFGAFFGFFETELRRYDFALGMYDARRLALERIASRALRAGTALRYPEDVPGASAKDPAWRRYRCLRAVVDGEKGVEETCGGDDLQDFRIVLQTQIERLWDRCARLGGQETYDVDELCRQARAGEPPRRVPFVKAVEGAAWRQLEQENDAGYSMRLLAAHGFQFEDLGLKREEAERAPAALRAQLLSVGDSIGRTQPLTQAFVIETLVKMAADEVAYVPPRATVWAMYGRDPEIGATWGFQMKRVFVAPVRLHAAVLLVGANQIFSSERGGAAVGLVAGAEYLPSWWSSTRLQPSILVRGGWMFAANDDAGFSTCPDPGNSTIGYCSRPMIQAGVSATLLERFRLQLTGNWYPPAQNGEAHQWAIGPAIGYQWGF